MNEINKLVLNIYQTSQNSSASDFPDRAFSLIKNQIHFDSAGFCDFNYVGATGIKLVSAAAHNVSTYDKLSARLEYIDQEKVAGQNQLSSEDPALTAAFNKKGTSVSVSLSDKTLKSNLVAYGMKTDSFQALTMVVTPEIRNRFQTVSLWRGKNSVEFLKADNAKADIILPHLFQAFAINRHIHKISEVKDPESGSAICSLSGTLSFLDEVAVEFLHGEFQSWNPPFLPPALLEKLRSTSEKIYVGKLFTLTAIRKKDLLFLNFKKTTRLEKLSTTELAVAEMLIRNETYKEIAQKLGNQPATVRNQAHNIYMKFGISGKAELSRLFKLHN